MPSIRLNGKLYSKGDSVTLNSNAPSMCYVPVGTVVQIAYTRADGDSIGLYSPNRKFDEWHDLDGRVSSNSGYWMPRRSLEKCIDVTDIEYVVVKDLISRGVQLKGLKCHSLTNLDNGSIFVEFDEDVNGCSADGHGKAGHCVALDYSDIKKVTAKKNEDKKSKKLSKAARKLKVAAANVAMESGKTF
jgi:hypothetical protein